MTRTLAALRVNKATYDEIKSKLTDADYNHLFREDGSIDMEGIALVRAALQPSSSSYEYETPLPRSFFIEFEKRFRNTLNQFTLGLRDIPELNGLEGSASLGDETIHRMISCALTDLPPVASLSTANKDPEILPAEPESKSALTKVHDGPLVKWAPAWLRSLRASVPPGKRNVGVLHEVADEIDSLAETVAKLRKTVELQTETLMRCCHCGELYADELNVVCDLCDPDES